MKVVLSAAVIAGAVALTKNAVFASAVDAREVVDELENREMAEEPARRWFQALQARGLNKGNIATAMAERDGRSYAVAYWEPRDYLPTLPSKDDPPKDDPRKKDPPKDDPPKKDPPKDLPPKKDPPKKDPPKDQPPHGWHPNHPHPPKDQPPHGWHPTHPPKDHPPKDQPPHGHPPAHPPKDHPPHGHPPAHPPKDQPPHGWHPTHPPKDHPPKDQPPHGHPPAHPPKDHPPHGHPPAHPPKGQPPHGHPPAHPPKDHPPHGHPPAHPPKDQPHHGYHPTYPPQDYCPTPRGYKLTYGPIDAANNDPTYLTFKFLPAYDTDACAKFCNDTPRCASFNIWQGIVDGRKQTNTCAIYKGVVTQATAKNTGDAVNKVKVTKSRGYKKL
ncbi:unnamed protein product [Sympodiomycopsis kandeliae]